MSDNVERKLKYQLEWVKNRLAALDIIGQKLKEMKALAEYAQRDYLSQNDKNFINWQIKVLEDEVNMLDDQSRKYEDYN